MAEQKWEDIAAAKRQILASLIPKQWIIDPSILPPDTQLDVTDFPEKSGWFTERELEITNKTASEILPKLASGEWTSLEVTTAFCKRAAAAHQLTNCLSDIMFDDALKQAKELDEYKLVQGKLKGPLHGLPVSLKDNLNVIGRDSTIGFVSYVNQPATYNSPLVDMLEEAGAVRYVKTNVPTAMMIAESVNNVFGRTLNPKNRNLTSGGSSGGESALILFGGSCLGVGSDIGGSLRIPASCTGLYTIRASFGRFPAYRTRPSLPGQEAVGAVNGPLARSIDDVILYSKIIVDKQPWLLDPKCIPIPWRTVEVKQQLKIGVWWQDGLVRPTPPVTRALKETVAKLKAKGHEIVEWDTKEHPTGIIMLRTFFVADGGKSIKSQLDPVKEPWRPEMKLYEEATELGVYELWQVQAARTELCKSYLEQWNQLGLDAILCPVSPFAAPKHEDFSYVGYTGIYNLIDYAAASFPSGVAADTELDAAYEGDKTPLSELDEAIQSKYSSKDVHGMPVSLQLVGRRLEEEKVLQMVKIVKDDL